jgi:hypothetical protein
MVRNSEVRIGPIGMIIIIMTQPALAYYVRTDDVQLWATTS